MSLAVNHRVSNSYDNVFSSKNVSAATFADEKKYLERIFSPPVVNTLLPALILTLASQKHAPDTRKAVDERYDYIIVGAGTVGSIVAARLSEVKCAKILLLEAGRNPPILTEIPVLTRIFANTNLDWRYVTESQKFTGSALKDRRVILPAGKAIGGSSIINSMLFSRGHRKIYDEWATRYGATGWSYNEILPYFKKYEHNMNPELVEKEFHGFEGPVAITKPKFDSPYKSAIAESFRILGYSPTDVNGIYQKGIYDYQSNTKFGQRCTVAKAYLVPASKRENLHIVEQAFVEKILIEDNRAIGVQFNFSGRIRKVFVNKEVILSAGTINSAQILLLSGIGPKKHLEAMEIPVISNLPVGENLQNHAAGIVTYYSKSLRTFSEKLLDPEYIRKYVTAREGMWAASQGIQYMAYLTSNRSADDDAVPDYQLTFIDSTVNLSSALKPEVYEQVYGPYRNVSTLWCLVYNMRPKSRGYVKLRSCNPYDRPVVDPQYLSDPQDVPNVIEGMKECDRVVLAEPFKELDVEPLQTFYPGCEVYKEDKTEYFRCQLKNIIFTASHQAGTVRMGNAHDPTTVVDPKLRLKNIKGLRVADCSIMPRIPSANPHAAAMMIGEKAADIIKEDMIINTL